MKLTRWAQMHTYLLNQPRLPLEEDFLLDSARCWLSFCVLTSPEVQHEVQQICHHQSEELEVEAAADCSGSETQAFPNPRVQPAEVVTRNGTPWTNYGPETLADHCRERSE